MSMRLSIGVVTVSALILKGLYFQEFCGIVHENMIANIWPDSKFYKMACRSIKEFYKLQGFKRQSRIEVLLLG